MTPEEKQMLKEVYEFMKSWNNSATISTQNDQAIRARFFGSSPELKASSKAAGSENQGVAESGSASYSVLSPPDGFDERDDNGTTKYYPYYI